MTSTSFGTQTPGLPQSLLVPPIGVQSQDAPGKDGAEVQQFKNFSGQYTFKAPAADDFAKGMLPYRPPVAPGATMEAGAGVTTGLISAIKALLGGARSGTLSSREPD